MDAQAGMLARLFEHSMGLGPEWRVEDVCFESPASGDEELHVRVGRVPGAAVACPECGARCGVYDARERTWRHLDIWQFRTVVHCRVPRADCPEHGPRTVRMPWEVRPNSHFTALFEAQVLVMAMSGMTVRAVSLQVRESDSRIWAMLGRAVAEAREGADYYGGGGPRGLLVRDQGGGRRRARPGDLLDHALERAPDEDGGADDPRRAGGRPQLVLREVLERLPGGRELDHTVAQKGVQGLQERRLLHNDDLPQAGEAGFLGPVRVGMCYPLETWKSQNIVRYLSRRVFARHGPNATRELPFASRFMPNKTKDASRGNSRGISVTGH